MIFLFFVAALTAILTFGIQILPGETFLAMPVAATAALHSAGGVAGWALGLAGEDVKAAVLVALPLVVGVKIAVLLWGIVRNWRPPIVSKIL